MEEINILNNKDAVKKQVLNSGIIKVAVFLGIALLGLLAIFPLLPVTGSRPLIASMSGTYYLSNGVEYYYSPIHIVFCVICVIYFAIAFIMALKNYIKNKNLSIYSLYVSLRNFTYVLLVLSIALSVFGISVHIHNAVFAYVLIVGIATIIEFLILTVASILIKGLRTDRTKYIYYSLSLVFDFILLFIIITASIDFSKIKWEDFTTYQNATLFGLIFVFMMHLSFFALPTTYPFSDLCKKPESCNRYENGPIYLSDKIFGIIYSIFICIFGASTNIISGVTFGIIWMIVSIIFIIAIGKYNEKAWELDARMRNRSVDSFEQKVNVENLKNLLWNSKSLKISNEKVVIREKISLTEYAQKMCKKINCSGISISEEEVKNLICAFASSRVVFLKINDQRLARKFSEVLSDCFSTELFTEYYNEKLDVETELDENKEKQNKRNGVESGLYTAYYMTNFIKAIYFNSYAQSLTLKAENFYESVANAYEHIILGNIKYLEENDDFVRGKMSVPDNLWVVGFVNDVSINNVIKEDWINYASIVDLNITDKAVEISDDNFEMLYMPFIQEVDEAQEEYYFNEDAWKKIDKLDEYLVNTVHFGIKNRFIRQVEKYVSVYLAMGGNQKEAMDAVMTSRILPWLASKKEELVSETVGDFALVIDEIFGYENIPNAKETLIRFGLKK